MTLPVVGAQDPERKNSPIAIETDEESLLLREQLGETDVCYFNDEMFADGATVRSGTVLLRCDAGIWVPINGSDPDNP